MGFERLVSTLAVTYLRTTYNVQRTKREMTEDEKECSRRRKQARCEAIVFCSYDRW